MGVSGGGGEPRWARTVEVEAVESRRLTPPGFGILRPGCVEAEEDAPAVVFAFAGGGQYCWW